MSETAKVLEDHNEDLVAVLGVTGMSPKNVSALLNEAGQDLAEQIRLLKDNASAIADLVSRKTFDVSGISAMLSGAANDAALRWI